MRTLSLVQDFKEAAAKLVGQFPERSHAKLAIHGDTKVIAPDGGISAVLLCKAIPSELHNRAFELWKPVTGLLSNRATAVGTLSLPRSTNKDGTPSPRSGVNVHVLDVVEARQGILGYVDRPCRKKTKLTKRCPEMLDGNRRLIERVNALYAQHMPHLYTIQRAEVEKAGPRWRLWATAFSTVYLAKNFRTAYHTDRGNLLGVMTALMPTGAFTGGELVLPRWRIAIAFKPGDLLLFDPQQLHGNLPFEGERISAAFYCSRHIANSGK
jgi:hypothetical protein